MRYGFVIDQRRCIGCHACTVACKEENRVPLGAFRTWVKYIERGSFPHTRRYFSVLRCNHCDAAPCVTICPTVALYRRADGIVDFDGERCIGCKSCMQACPYDALYIDPETQTAAKCHYCAHRIEVGLEPAPALAGALAGRPEAALARAVARFPEVVEDAVWAEETVGLTTYATELATTFHAFYRDARVVDPAEPERSRSRLALAQATRTTLANALGLLGISAPESM